MRLALLASLAAGLVVACSSSDDTTPAPAATPTYAKDIYAGRPAITTNQFGNGRAIYIGTMGNQPFYHDLAVWIRQLCGINPLLKVPDTVEVSMRQKGNSKIFFLINHQNSPVRIPFYKPMHDFLSGKTFTGNYDLPPHGVLVLDENVSAG